jgi:hypothetical protein
LIQLGNFRKFLMKYPEVFRLENNVVCLVNAAPQQGAPTTPRLTDLYPLNCTISVVRASPCQRKTYNKEITQQMFFQLDDNNQPQIVYPICQPLPAMFPVAPPVVHPVEQPEVNDRPELEILATQALPGSSTAPLFYNGTTWSNGDYVALPHCFEIFDNQGQRIPPLGFSFVRMNVPACGSPEPVPQNVGMSCPPSPELAPETMESSSSQASTGVRLTVATPTQGSSRSPSAEPHQFEDQAEKPQKNRKFRHRSKQERIQQVHEELRLRYTAMGLYANNDEVLRGFDTVRVHVKTYHALSKIHQPLEDVENHPYVKIHKIATPFSMKNKFQKKGFIVYLKLKHRDMVPYVQDIFSKYKEHFNKCDLALKKEDKIAMQEEAARMARNVILPEPSVFPPEDAEPEPVKFDEIFWERPNMAKKSSGLAA